MDRNDLSTHQQRQLKFAEAGVLFVLVMALTLFLGVKLTSNRTGLGEDAEQPRVTAAVPVAADTAPTAVTQSSAEFAVATADPHTAATQPVDEPTAPEPQQPREVSYAEAETAYFAKHWGEAADLFAEYTRQNPENAWGFYMLGLSQRQVGSPAAAEQSLLAALKIAPDHTQSQVNLARVRLDLGQAAEAVEPLQQALANEPQNVQAHRVLGRAFSELGSYDAAIAAYHDALHLDPYDAWSLNNLGLLYIQTERFAAAVAPLARACQLDSSVACFENNLGVALERSGQPGAAAAAFAAALVADADYAKADDALERLDMCGASTEPITIDLVAAAAELRFDRATDSFAAADQAAVSDPPTAADGIRSDDDRPQANRKDR